MAIKNKYDYRGGVLEALNVEHTPSDLRNEDEYRKKVLEGFGVEYTDDDINQMSLFREKVVEGLASGSGGGGSSDFSTAEVTFINNTNAEEYINGAFIGSDMLQYVSEIGTGTSTKQAVIYKSGSKAYVDDETATISVSGDATYNDGVITITGNCTITIS